MTRSTNIKSQVGKLEKRLFEIICLMIITVLVHGLVEGLVLWGGTFLSLIESALLLLLGSFYYLSKYKNKFGELRIPFIIIINACMVFFWFWLSGFKGPMSVGALGICALSMIIVPTAYRTRLLIGTSLLVGVLVLLQIFTTTVRVTENSITLPFDYLVIFFAVLMVINFLKSEVDKERRVVLQQNEELEFLNEELKFTIEEKERAIRELKTTQKKLIESEKMASIGRLTAGLAHELNNPLNYIGGSVKPISDDLVEIEKHLTNGSVSETRSQFTEIRRLLRNIEDGSNRSSEIVGNLLKNSPRSINETQLVQVHDLVQRTCSLVQNAHTHVHISLIIKDPVMIMGNGVEINQVLLNVIKNAVDAVNFQSRGKVIVVVTKKNKKAEILVSDNGPGISTTNRSQIFEPFFTTKEEGKGTGLGLYISYGIIKKHNGTIRLDPRYKNGSQFVISLPLAEESVLLNG